MPRFDRNRTDFVQQKSAELIEDERTGIVTRVYEHTDANDTSNFEVDVTIRGGSSKETRVPLQKPGPDSYRVPKVDDKVVVTYLEGDSRPPIITGYVDTVDDRAPVGKAGIRRDVFQSGASPAGTGDIYFTGYTSYDGNPSLDSADLLTAEETFVQLAKRADTEADPSEETSLPAKIEFYDSPLNDESYITVELNKLDGADTTAPWGMKFNLKTGEVKLVDASGYGIVSDGSGNFTWEYESKTETQVSGGGSLSL